MPGLHFLLLYSIAANLLTPTMGQIYEICTLNTKFQDNKFSNCTWRNGNVLDLTLNYPHGTVISCKCKNCLTVRESFECMSNFTWQSQNPDHCASCSRGEMCIKSIDETNFSCTNSSVGALGDVRECNCKHNCLKYNFTCNETRIWEPTTEWRDISNRKISCDANKTTFSASLENKIYSFSNGMFHVTDKDLIDHANIYYCNSEGNLMASPQSKELLSITIALCLVLLLTIITVIWLVVNQLGAKF